MHFHIVRVHTLVLQLRPDFVKLDRDLVADCDRDEARLAVLEMLGDFAGRIDA